MITPCQAAYFRQIQTLVLGTAFLFAVVATADEPTVIRGRVLLPDGKPAARAELCLIQSKPALAERPDELAFEKHAAADDQGRFEFSLTEQEAPLENMTRSLIAYLPGSDGRTR